MYEQCLECKKLGNPCDGPNFLAMNTDDLIAWCNERRKKTPGLTYDRIAEQTGLSKGTVSGFFGGIHADYRTDTIRPILKLLVGGEWDDNPCADPTASERAAYEEKIRQLEAGIAWRDDKIQHLTEEGKQHQEQYQKNTDFLKGSVKTLKRALISVSILLGIALLLIIIALIVDRLNGDMGFFWLDGLLNPHGINEIIQQWRT